MTAHWKIIIEKDSINLIKIEKILNERGWLGADIIGAQGNGTLFLVIHSVHSLYFPLILIMQSASLRNGATMFLIFHF